MTGFLCGCMPSNISLPWRVAQPPEISLSKKSRGGCRKASPKRPPSPATPDALQRLSRPAAARRRLSPHGQLLPRTALMLGQKGNKGFRLYYEFSDHNEGCALLGLASVFG